MLDLPVASLAAFVFARFSFRGREALYTIFTLGLLFPVAVAILPLFIMVRKLGLLDNPLGVALPQAAFALPLTIMILRPFFRGIPSELQDAAAIDGCGPAALLRADLAAAVAPGAGHGRGADDRQQLERVPAALVVLTDSGGWTLPIGVTNFSTQYTTDTARVLAFTTLSMVPGADLLRVRRAPARPRA